MSTCEALFSHIPPSPPTHTPAFRCTPIIITLTFSLREAKKDPCKTKFRYFLQYVIILNC